MQLTHVCVIYLGCLKAKFKSLCSSYQRCKETINKWNKLPSGSAGRPKYKPKSYKYAAELSFLDDVTFQRKLMRKWPLIHPLLTIMTWYVHKCKQWTCKPVNSHAQHQLCNFLCKQERFQHICITVHTAQPLQATFGILANRFWVFHFWNGCEKMIIGQKRTTLIFPPV